MSMTNLHGSIGFSQLKKLDEVIKAKSKINSYYENNIKKINGLKITRCPSNTRSNFWLNKKTYIFLEAPVKWRERDMEGFHIIDERKIGDSLLITYLTSNY